jgi:maleate cis-trans isomerase
MSDWDRKLGLIVPSWNSVNEYEFQRVLAPSISVHTTRVAIHADDEENFARMAEEIPSAAKLLAQAKVEAICYGCFAGGVCGGAEHDSQIIHRIQDSTGVPGVAAARAVTDALHAIGADCVSVASPYQPWLNEKLREYLRHHGITVLAIEGLGTQEHAKFTPGQNLQLARSVDRTASQALLITCSNFRTLEIIQLLERELGKPVLSSNMCSLWKMLRVLGDTRIIPEAGRLFCEA